MYTIVNQFIAEFIDTVFTKISPKSSFSIIENERFGLVFAITWSINSGHMTATVNPTEYSVVNATVAYVRVDDEQSLSLLID
jgi:hypothetical protein